LLIISLAIFGMLFGAYTAKKKGGNASDIIQYAVVFLIIGLIVGIFSTIAIEWL